MISSRTKRTGRGASRVSSIFYFRLAFAVQLSRQAIGHAPPLEEPHREATSCLIHSILVLPEPETSPTREMQFGAAVVTAEKFFLKLLTNGRACSKEYVILSTLHRETRHFVNTSPIARETPGYERHPPPSPARAPSTAAGQTRLPG